jgi:serine/threonine protein phosphatase PrpC
VTTLRWGSATDTGRLRDQNEDALLVTETLFVVADGMGGHAAGEVAAQISVETLRDTADGTRDGIVEAVRVANRAILERSGADPETRGMGTTLSAVALVTEGDAGEEMVLVANVGDSRVYRVHRGELEQLSEDHSLVEDLVRAGRISPAEARTHPNRNIVTRVLGTDAEVEVDSWLITPEAGDRYLLCSDGLYREASDDDIAGVLESGDAMSAVQSLLAHTLRGRAADNVTAVVVDAQPGA